jgi:hypothetical protein
MKKMVEIGVVEMFMAGAMPQWEWKFGPEAIARRLLILSVGAVVMTPGCRAGA